MYDRKFYIGGYFLVLPAKRSDCMGKGLLPNMILTVSDCICDNLLGQWILEWPILQGNTDYYLKILNLSENKLNQLKDDMVMLFDTQKFGIGNVFTELEVARNMCKKYLNHIKGVKILGIGLNDIEYEIFDEEEELERWNSYFGINICLNRKELMDTTNILGFDILGYDYGNFHSFICNGLQKDIYDKFNIKPNRYGLFDKYDDAEKATDYISCESIGAEPALWQPWIVCEYSI